MSADNSEDSINKSIEIIEGRESNTSGNNSESSLPDTIREINKTLFKDNPLKMGNLSHDNRKGMTQIMVLNEFMEETYGYRFSALDNLVIDTMNRGLSVNAFGIAAFNDALKSIQASFNNVGEVSALKKMMGR